MSEKRLKLSKKKKKWAETTKPTATLRGSALNNPIGVEKKYAREVRKILAAVRRTTECEVRKLFKTSTAREFFAQDDSLANEAKKTLDRTFAKIEEMARRRGLAAAETMVGAADVSSQSAMVASLKELSGGVTLSPDKLGGAIPDTLRAAINVNVDLISSISEAYLGKVSDAVNRSIMFGRGVEDLIPFFKAQEGITDRHAKNLALDQTRKAYSSLNAVRMQNAGLTEFEWLHSRGGQVPRKLHITPWPAGLNGGIFSFDDPPIIDEKTGERGLPAQAINCKCRLLPVLRLDKGKPS